MRHHADAHSVDEARVLVAVVKAHLAADRRNADAVAVMADAGDRASKQEAALGAGQFAEPQRVEQRDRPCSHRDDVADDAPDSGGRAFERLDGAGVVVAFDFERDRHPVAHVDRTGVLARPLQDVRAFGGEPAEQWLGVLVGAVLAPHQAEHHKLGVGGVATQKLRDALGLPVGQAQLAVAGEGLGPQRASTLIAPISASNSTRPSSDPTSGSHAHSGWGIMPSTLPSRLAMPATRSCEPVGLVAS